MTAARLFNVYCDESCHLEHDGIPVGTASPRARGGARVLSLLGDISPGVSATVGKAVEAPKPTVESKQSNGLDGGGHFDHPATYMRRHMTKGQRAMAVAKIYPRQRGARVGSARTAFAKRRNSRCRGEDAKFRHLRASREQ